MGHKTLKSLKISTKAYLSEDTIVSAFTGSDGAVLGVRISGKEAWSVFDRFLHTPSKVVPRKTILKKIFRPSTQTLLDEGMVIYFEENHSFTGEKTVEVYFHASPRIYEIFLEECAFFQVRVAYPGEFSFRAVKNGKMDLLQAQAVSDLIQSKTDLSLELSLETFTKKNEVSFLKLKKKLRDYLAFLEAHLDFSDQDIGSLSEKELRLPLQEAVQILESLVFSYERGKAITEGVSICIFGLPNAGKSTLFNSLLGENRSIISDEPGTTRDTIDSLIRFQDQKHSVLFRFLDTAGFRESSEKIESLGIERTKEALHHCDLILYCVSSETTKKEQGMCEQLLAEHNKPVLKIITKSDLLSEHNHHETYFSVYQPEGWKEVWNKILSVSEPLTHRDPGEYLVTKKEVQNACIEAKKVLVEAKNQSLDLLASDVRQALRLLNPIFGETLTEDILGDIFSSFCIGK